MMQAIRVKQNLTHNGNMRLSARAQAGRIGSDLSAIEHELSVEGLPTNTSDCAQRLAEKLAVKFGWNAETHGKLHGGVLHDGSFVFVLVK